MDRSRHAPFLITGRFGQLGSAWQAELQAHAQPFIAVGREELDFSAEKEVFFAQLDTVWSATPFKTILNGAAYTAVDRAESEERLALRVNGEAVGWLGEWAARHGVQVIHFSTDYVFSGLGECAWKETDAPDPINAYGRTKLTGEQRLISAHRDGAWIFRTSWVYDSSGKNFFRTIQRLASEKPELRVVSDQWGAPSYAPTLAAGVLRFLGSTPQFSDACGTYHFCGSGVTNWSGFARAILSELHLSVPVVDIPSSAYPTPAKRPGNSRLDLTKLTAHFGWSPPAWQRDLAACVRQMKGHA